MLGHLPLMVSIMSAASPPWSPGFARAMQVQGGGFAPWAPSLLNMVLATSDRRVRHVRAALSDYDANLGA